MKFSRKILSLFISASFVFSMSAFSINSVFAAVDENGCYVPDSSVETNRYYFAMPDDWYNENTDTAGVYWRPSSELPVPSQDVLTWPGYKANKGDFSDVYYVDCPTDITAICWNNFIDGGNDIEDPVYYQEKSSDIYAEFCALINDSDIYAEEWFAEMEKSYKGDKTALGNFAENFFYDEQFGFCFNFDNMIYVIDYTVNKAGYQGRDAYFGDWYFYYGNGEYGIYPTREQSESNSVLKTVSQNGKKIDLGDTDLDGTISIKDSTEIQKYLVGLSDFTYVQKFVSNFNGDMDINISDATDIQKLLVL